MKRILIIAALLIGFGLVFDGCYTLLKHPRVQNESTVLSSENHTGERILPSDDCLQCHDQGDDYYNPNLPYSNYYQGRSRAWLFYYDSPWWVEPYYYGGAISQKDSLPSPRQFGRRGYQPDSGPAGQPAISGSTAPATAAAKRAKKSAKENPSGTRATEDRRRQDKRSTVEKKDEKQKRRVKKKKENNPW